MENIYFTGYPKGIYDKWNCTPLMRKGVSATPIYFDYLGLPQFLIDAPSFEGSSGSPVILCNFNPNDELASKKRNDYLLGILANTIKQGEIYLNLGVVLKSRLILDTIKDFFRVRKII